MALPTISHDEQRERTERYRRAKAALREGTVKVYEGQEAVEIVSEMAKSSQAMRLQHDSAAAASKAAAKDA